MENIVTAMGTSNIALIKYWGKRDERLILPTHSSISITLDEHLSAKTSLVFSKSIKADTFYLNGKLQDLREKEIGEKFNIIDHVRRLAGAKERVLVVSENNFPTATGLASSAAGMATLVYAASKALGLNLSAKELSIIVRLGSGSACRSVVGGFVLWRKGTRKDGRDSYAEQIADENYWPEINDLIAVISETKKKVSSRSGMRQTVKTSELYRIRPRLAENFAARLKTSILKKDFRTLAEITMKESNNLHATMLDTYPPIMYLNDGSKEAINAVHELNETEGRPICAYTFDAGPNAHIITLDKYKRKVRKRLEEIDSVMRFIDAKAGGGPRILKEKDSLIEARSLMPISGK